MLGGGLLGAVFFGAVGNVATDAIKGNIHSKSDIAKSAFRGALANGIGWCISKGIAALKVQSIKHMPRSARKCYLRNNIFNNTANSQALSNINMYRFMGNSLRANIKLVERSLTIFKSGFYSTATSTLSLIR